MALARECWFTLTPVQTNSVGSAPQSVAVGDFNGDGRPDLVVANQFSANVSVLLGNGNGTFQPAVNYGAGQGPSGVAVGDFNGDNKSDLAVANSSVNTVSVLLGNGNGTFQTAASYPAGAVPVALTVRDLNADAVPDLAVANRSSSAVSVLLGNGDGTFQAVVSYPAGVGPQFVAAGDFNNDSRADLAVANAALFEVPPSVSVLLGKQPNGTFQNSVDYDAGISPRAMVIEDFNHDGKRDLAVANYGQIAGPTTTNSSIPVLMGRGDGTFSNAVHYPAGAGPIALAVADFDTNSVMDLVVANDRSGTLSILFGNANGTFGPPNDFRAGVGPRSVAVSDFNGDAKPDVAVVNDSGVLILLNDCLVGGDLVITMLDTPDPVTFDRDVVYTLTVTNRGPDPSFDVTVTNRLPAGLSFVAATSSQGSCTNASGTIVCALGTMTNGTQVTITLTATAVTGPITNSATVFSATTTDYNLANNTVTAVTTVRPILSISSTDPTAAEAGPDPGFFTVRRTGGTVGPLAFNYVVSGTASSGADYSPLSGFATIPNGSATTSIAVSPVNDPAVEATETVILTLAASSNYVVNLSSNRASVSILDNDVYALTINDVAVNEGDAGTATAIFTVSLSWSNPQPVSVSFSTANGTATAGNDYIATNGVLTFAPGVTNQTVVVPVRVDTQYENNEFFFVGLFSPINAVIADGLALGTIINDDPLPVLTINDASVLEGNSGQSIAIFTVRLSSPHPATVFVNFTTANGTAAAGSDYLTNSGLLAFAPGQTNQTVTVPVAGDALNELNETFFVNLSNPTNATLADNQGVGVIVNDDPLPSLSINDLAVTEGDSSTANAVFAVALSAASGQRVTVDFATSDGTATATNASQALPDYVAVAGITTFDPGTTNQFILVPISGDILNESNETFFVNLSNPTNAILSDVQAVGTIHNNDPLPSLSINAAAVFEGDSGTTHLVFTLRLTPPSGQQVTVNFATSDGTADAGDYVSTNGMLQFAPGQTQQSASVLIRGDTQTEDNETFFINLNAPINATLAVNQALGLILNDEGVPFITITGASGGESSGGGSNVIAFNARLSAPYDKVVTVGFATADGTAVAAKDYLATNGVINFAPGTTNQTISVSILDDLLDEDDETLLLNLSGSTNGIVTINQGLGIIVDDDAPPTLLIGNQTLLEGNVGVTNAMFAIQLSVESGRPVTVNFATAAGTATAGSDYSSTNGTVIFAPGTTNLAIAVGILGDGLDEADENFFVNLSAPTNATINAGQAVGVILDDDPLPALTINNVTVNEGNAGFTQAVFTTSLSAPSGRTVAVNFVTSAGTATAGTDYLSSTGQVTFPAGMTTQPIAVTVLGEQLYETNETFHVNLDTPVNAILSTNQGIGTINNDDSPPSITISNASVFEGNSGTANLVFAVGLSEISAVPATVSYTTVNGTATRQTGDYERIVIAQLSFQPGETNRSISVVVYGDSTVETNETLFVSLSSPTDATLANNQATGTILNDDGVPSLSITDFTLVEGHTDTTNAIFAVRLSTSYAQVVTVNYATAGSSATSGTDFLATNGMVTFPANTTNQTIAVRVVGDRVSESNETFQVTVSGAINALISDGTGAGIIVDDDPFNFLLSTNSITVAEGGTSSFSVRLFSAPASDVSITTVRTSGATNLQVFSGTTLSFTPTNWNAFQPVVISASPDTNTSNETAVFAVSNAGTIQLVNVTALDNTGVAARIVGADLTGGNVIIRFTTAANRTYQVERTADLNSGTWSTVGIAVTGTGATMEVTDFAGAGQPGRFYRVVLLTP